MKSEIWKTTCHMQPSKVKQNTFGKLFIFIRQIII
ncbi:unnamed protein product [Paramecium primaurelia]|uniref:Uncharacterized protein n=1 Tax=Paramecium primaurelia TaxID=5886 RepID=A0A8S1QK89_PARPR|nr:unnamed protein product [Paramecium primaurelia]